MAPDFKMWEMGGSRSFGRNEFLVSAAGGSGLGLVETVGRLWSAFVMHGVWDRSAAALAW